MVRFKAWMQLLRWKNLMLICVSQILILISLFTVYLDFVPALFFILNTILITAGGNIINDYYDVETDKINKPKKCIIPNIVQPQIALVVYIVLNTIAFILNTIVFFVYNNWLVFVVVNSIIILLFMYSKYLKGRPLVGNLAIATLTSISVLLLMEFGDLQPYELNTIRLLAVYAFVLNLIRELIKDIQDIKGDKKVGLTTLPILIGVNRVKQIAKIMILLVLVSLSILCFWMTLLVKLFTCFLLILPLIYIYKLLKGKENKINYAKISSFLKLIIGFGIILIIII